MTLSQGLIKKWLLPFVLCFSMIFVVFPISEASANGGTGSNAAYTYPANIVTEDGRWDGTLYTTSTHRDVDLEYGGVTLYSKSTRKFVRMGDLKDISIRLCNASTGSCTAWKTFPNNVFSNLKANQKYYLDVRDKYSAYYAIAGGRLLVY